MIYGRQGKGAAGAGKRHCQLRVRLFDLNGEYNDVLRQLGQVMVETHQGLAADPERVTALLAQADERAERIAELKSRISDLKQAQACPVCGEPCGKSDKFCRACGGQL